MGNEDTGKEIVATSSQESKINFVNETFKISDTVEHLHGMMKDVTEKEVNAANVNAACNCVSQLVDVIDMTIRASRFLGEK